MCPEPVRGTSVRATREEGKGQELAPHSTRCRVVLGPGAQRQIAPTRLFFHCDFPASMPLRVCGRVSPLGFSGFLRDERLFVPVTSLSGLRHRGVNCDGLILDVLITSLVRLERGSGCFGRGTRSPWLRGASSLHSVLLRALPSEDSPRRHFSFK